MGVPSLNDLAVDGTLNTTNQPNQFVNFLLPGCRRCNTATSTTTTGDHTGRGTAATAATSHPDTDAAAAATGTTTAAATAAATGCHPGVPTSGDTFW